MLLHRTAELYAPDGEFTRTADSDITTLVIGIEENLKLRQLKAERVHGTEYEDHDEANRHLLEYIEVFYNREREQAALSYQSPAALEAQFHPQSLTEAA